MEAALFAFRRPGHRTRSHAVEAGIRTAISEPMWIDAARSTFIGTVIVGQDLLEI